ncbi:MULTISPECIES: class I SAM-dependent methyltransferase [Brucella/Ochrobactrum group]|uniref:class I SAM-dependent methyltransferase n=1 Tax=Brucella/Ochrobactrum group TaxID=2826938 RepID=UPI001121ED79|nr:MULTISPECIES: class I SAM-dependent methyltransferase [Brucella/Ochrobactrum group]
MNNRYGNLAAWVYQLDKPVGRSFGDVELYRDLLDGTSGPILEPAVGNGRMLVPLLEAGFDVYGFDTSPEMLAYCETACKIRGLNANLSQQSFLDFTFASMFSAVIVPAGSIQLVTDTKEALAVLRRFHDALSVGGRLILDLDSLRWLSAPAGTVRHWKDGDDMLTLQEERLETDFANQTTTSLLRYEHWTNGKLVNAEIETFSLRFWGIWEMELALRAAGFQSVKVHAGYERDGSVTPDSEMVTFEILKG